MEETQKHDEGRHYDLCNTGRWRIGHSLPYENERHLAIRNSPAQIRKHTLSIRCLLKLHADSMSQFPTLLVQDLGQ